MFIINYENGVMELRNMGGQKFEHTMDVEDATKFVHTLSQCLKDVINKEFRTKDFEFSVIAAETMFSVLYREAGSDDSYKSVLCYKEDGCMLHMWWLESELCHGRIA